MSKELNQSIFFWINNKEKFKTTIHHAEIIYILEPSAIAPSKINMDADKIFTTNNTNTPMYRTPRIRFAFVRAVKYSATGNKNKTPLINHNVLLPNICPKLIFPYVGKSQKKPMTTNALSINVNIFVFICQPFHQRQSKPFHRPNELLNNMRVQLHCIPPLAHLSRHMPYGYYHLTAYHIDLYPLLLFLHFHNKHHAFYKNLTN